MLYYYQRQREENKMPTAQDINAMTEEELQEFAEWLHEEEWEG
jgi:hypothetical protein